MGWYIESDDIRKYFDIMGTSSRLCYTLQSSSYVNKVNRSKQSYEISQVLPWLIVLRHAVCFYHGWVNDLMIDRCLTKPLTVNDKITKFYLIDWWRSNNYCLRDKTNWLTDWQTAGLTHWLTTDDWLTETNKLADCLTYRFPSKLCGEFIVKLLLTCTICMQTDWEVV